MDKSRTYDLTDEGEESLIKLKKEWELQSWAKEKEVIVTEANLQEIEDQFNWNRNNEYV